MKQTQQKFHAGDLVQVAKDLGSHMSHFRSDCRAIVVGSYHDQYGGNDRNRHIYTLWLEGHGQSSWYDENQLELIEPNQHALLKQWEAERDARDAQQSDLDWIFANGESVLSGASGATVEALGKHLGCNSLWGSRGEGITYYMNSIRILTIAEPFLKDGDKEGFLAACKLIELSRATDSQPNPPASSV